MSALKVAEASQKSYFLSCVRIRLKKNSQGTVDFQLFKDRKMEEVSPEMRVLEACNAKIGVSLAQDFESLMPEIWKSRTKPSFSRSWEVPLAFRRVAETCVSSCE